MNISEDAVISIVSTLVGGAIAIAGTYILEWRKEATAHKELLAAIENELLDLRDRLVAVVFIIETHLGLLNRDLLQWIQKNSLSSAQIDQQAGMALSELLAMNDAAIRLFAMKLKGSEQRGKGLKKFHLAFLNSQLSKIGELSLFQQRLIFEIRHRMEVINQEIERGQQYFDSTFTPNTHAENQKVLRENIYNSYLQVAKDARLVAESISTYQRGEVA